MQQANATVVPLRQYVDNEAFRRVADALPQIVWVANAGGKAEYFNQLWHRYTGLDEATSLGPDRWKNAYHTDDVVGLRARWDHSLATGEDFDVEFRIRRHDGVFRWFLCRGQAMRNEHGLLENWCGTLTDIDDKKRVEEKLRDRENEFRQLANAVPQKVWVTRTDGYHEYFNQRWYDFTGVSPDTTDGESWSHVFHPDDQPKAWERWRHSLKTGEPYEIEYRLRRHDGEYRWMLGRALPMRDEGGTIVRWFGTCTDIHDRMAERHQLEQATKQAEAASMAKTEFLANMSHEIRTPMNAVVGLANILSASDGLSDKQHEYISTLQVSAEQLLQLINDLLDVSRIESNGLHLEAIPFDLNRVVQEALSINAVRAREKHITLGSRGHCTQSLIGDPLRIKQIIMNLVGNAVKFTEDGAVNVNIFYAPRVGSRMIDVMIAVEDTGIGIAASKIDEIFGKFSQAESSTTRRYGGSGLGLSIVKTLVELMGGQVTVNSKPGQGSCFTVTLALPTTGTEALDAPSNTAKNAGVPKETAKTGNRVLLVEDYHANVLVATMLLQNYGYSYALASSGEEAVKKLEEEDFAVVLMDVQMPQMNGYQATAIIREREAANGNHTPIVGMTAHALKGDRDRCIDAGMDDYIAKPFRPEMLKAMLEKYCGLATAEASAT